MSEINPSATQSFTIASRLQPIMTPEHVPEPWRGSPIEEFIGAHNFDTPVEPGSKPKLLIVSCIEFRFRPIIPNMFAYVMRTPGGCLSQLPESSFALAYILAKGVRHIALVGHNDCGMTKVFDFKPRLIEALEEQGWEPDRAREFIEQNAGRFAIDDEIDSLETEFNRLNEMFEKVTVAPLFCSLSSTRLHIPKWYRSWPVGG